MKRRAPADFGDCSDEETYLDGTVQDAVPIHPVKNTSKTIDWKAHVRKSKPPGKLLPKDRSARKREALAEFGKSPEDSEESLVDEFPQDGTLQQFALEAARATPDEAWIVEEYRKALNFRRSVLEIVEHRKLRTAVRHRS